MRIVKRYIFRVIAKCEHTQTNERTDAVLTLYLSGWFRLWLLGNVLHRRCFSTTGICSQQQAVSSLTATRKEDCFSKDETINSISRGSTNGFYLKRTR